MILEFKMNIVWLQKIRNIYYALSGQETGLFYQELTLYFKCQQYMKYPVQFSIQPFKYGICQVLISLSQGTEPRYSMGLKPPHIYC